MILRHVGHHLFRRLRRVDLARRFDEGLLIAPQVCFGNRQQVGKRSGDHFVGRKHLLVGVCAVRERAVRLGKQLVLQPPLVVIEGGGDADAVISASSETFEKIVAGEQNPTSAYMMGKIKLKGDMGAAMKLQKLFPS